MIIAHHSTRARQLHRLPANILKIAKPGSHGDGGGLRLLGSKSGAIKWIFRYSLRGHVREAGLGSARNVSLPQARQKAAGARELLALGIDPLDKFHGAGEPEPPIRSFGEVAKEFLASRESGWRNAKHRKQWRATLETHAAPLWGTPVDEIDLTAVLGVLTPIWQRIPETAARVRARIERVLDYAKVHKLRTGDNPAAWRGNLEATLPKRPTRDRGHHAAMDYRDVPAFVAKLRECNTTAAMALEFAILTAARSGEVRGARWPEIDLAERVWTIPGSRMKSGRTHRVPLSARAIAILEKLAGGSLIFPLSANAMLSATLHRMGETCTVHGFRSSFRDWCGNETSFPREIAEAALAHVSGDATEQAYRRSDALEKRRALMTAWAAFCVPGAQEPNVVPLRA
jgi:integrase